MKNKKKLFGNLKFNKEKISNLSTNSITGGGTSGITKCNLCPSRSVDFYDRLCEPIGEPHNPGPGTVQPIPDSERCPRSNPDMAC